MRRNTWRRPVCPLSPPFKPVIVGEIKPVNSSNLPYTLPAILRKRDLFFIAALSIIGVPYMSAMQFAGLAAFSYWGLALLTLLIPCIFISSWLVRHAPARVPVYSWIMR